MWVSASLAGDLKIHVEKKMCELDMLLFSMWVAASSAGDLKIHVEN